ALLIKILAAVPLLEVACSPVPLLLLAYTPVPPAEALPYTPNPLGVLPYIPHPEPSCEPQTPIPSPPVPAFIPRTPAEKPPGEVVVTLPITPFTLEAAAFITPSTGVPSPLLAMENNVAGLSSTAA